ncbi:MAG: aspartate/tyrosine/aromatic aminotransferase, partial [Pantoea sp. Brub]|nr:aspartate/tyrosine/aromatic aminotransferase [Pantoea sp. Brub]
PILKSVKKAEQYLLANEITKNYLSIDGLPSFIECTKRILFGEKHSLLHSDRICISQTLGGTGALRISADLLSKCSLFKRIWISQPSWPNHQNIFNSVGLETHYYRYYNKSKQSLDFDGMIESLKKTKKGDVVLLHACCHNPTGIDLNIQEWEELIHMSHHYGWLPLFDFAYQGFANSIHEDAKGLRLFASSVDELIIANSYSKNFGLYNERIGAITLLSSNANITKNMLSQIKNIIRSNYSNPPIHGAAIVSTIINCQELYAMWKEELSQMCHRIKYMRTLFVQTLIDKGLKENFNFIINQNGMFSCIALSEEQINRLYKEFSIYIVKSGRINLAGMTTKTMPKLCDAIIKVL